TSATCTHPAGNAGTVCRAAVNECDAAETCPGATSIGFRGAVSASSGGASSATSLAISRPSGTLANDVMVASITSRTGSGTPTISAPAGWTLIVSTPDSGNNLTTATYWKVAGTAGADPGPYTFTVSSSRVAGGISAYSNVDTTNPINASGGQASSSAPSITTTVANTMLVACFGRAGGSAIGAPTGMSERFHAETSSSTNAASESADVAQASAGATGQKASTGNTASIGQLIALAPASTSCPPDTVKAAGTSCTDDGIVCTADVCNGTVGAPACTHAAGNAGTVCRAAVGGCDVAETCTGTSTVCPADASECDVAERCTGSTASCPADALSAAGTVCRAAVGACDVAETCTGTSITCPADAIQPAGAVCRAVAGECDVAETCNGSSTTCPTDTVMPAGTACTADTNPCTFDQCNGSSNTCQHTTGACLTQTKSAAGTCADATGIGTVAWTNASRAQASDNSYATAAFTASGQASHYLKCTDFGFTIPSNGTIAGIQVDWEDANTTSGTIKDNAARIVK